MGKLVSVIVPVYNVIGYLDNCILSILEQSYKNIELILIDNGSNDGSYEKCEKWAQTEKRIVLLKEEKLGVSLARNRGLDIAKGHYVTFVDSDDIIEHDAIKKYVEYIEQNRSEMVFTEYKVNKGQKTSRNCYNEEIILKPDEAIICLLSPEGLHGSVWSKLYVKDIIDNHRIRFHEDIRYCEDVLFNFEYLKVIQTIYYAPIKEYIYSIRDGSTMSQKVVSLDDKRLDIVKVFKLITEDSKNKAYYRLAASRLVYQTCKIIPSFEKFEGGKRVIKALKKETYKYLRIFFLDNTYSVLIRCKSAFKFFFPIISYRLSGESKAR